MLQITCTSILRCKPFNTKRALIYDGDLVECLYGLGTELLSFFTSPTPAVALLPTTGSSHTSARVLTGGSPPIVQHDCLAFGHAVIDLFCVDGHVAHHEGRPPHVARGPSRRRRGHKHVRVPRLHDSVRVNGTQNEHRMCRKGKTTRYREVAPSTRTRMTASGVVSTASSVRYFQRVYTGP